MAVMTADQTCADPVLAQRMNALKRANGVRVAGSDVKRDVAAGRLSVSAALEDERARSLTVFDLLLSQRQWGRARVRKAMTPHMIREGKRVSDLTERQRGLVRAAVGEF